MSDSARGDSDRRVDAGRGGGPAGDPVPAGLCDTCRHMRRIRSKSGSVFRLCLLSRSDPRFPRYPKLPVLACPGHVEAETEPEGGKSGSQDAGDASVSSSGRR